MNIKQQCITEYLTQGDGYGKLAAKYAASRTSINKWASVPGWKNINSTTAAIPVSYIPS